jgi:hypothetical protein
VIDRFAGFEGRGAQRPRRFSPLPAHGSRAAHACPESRSTTRMICLREVLLHSGSKIGGWRMAEIHEPVVSALRAQGEELHREQERPSSLV